ncbi:MAG: EamA family transporter, partial [Parcubacteria group bacterium]
MNPGFFLSIAAGFLWSIGNVIDKAAVSKFLKRPALLALIFSIVSVGAGLVTLPSREHWLRGADWWWMAVSGFLYMIATLWYFMALKREEASRVVPLFALTIVFLTVQSALFLNEIFEPLTYGGIALVVIATVLLMSRSNILDAFRSKAFGLMVASTCAYALSYVIMKRLLGTYTDIQVFSFHRIFVGTLGIILLLFFIKELRTAYREAKRQYIPVSALSEAINVIGAFLFTAASAVWFVTLVETVVSIQYAFIFLW